MHSEVFADGIGEITVTGQTVRIDLVSLSPHERDSKGQPAPAFRQRIILPVEAFANGFQLMSRVMEGLVEAGAVRRNPPPAPEHTTFNTLTSPNFS